MKRATMEDLVEVNQLAVAKLSGLEQLLRPIEYDRILLGTMRTIAADLSLQILNSLITIESQEGIAAFESHTPSCLMADLLILCDLHDVRPWLEKLCADDRVRSVILRVATPEDDQDAAQLAAQHDNVPMFVVRSTGEVANLVYLLDSETYTALKLALNGERVALRFLAGNPS